MNLFLDENFFENKFSVEQVREFGLSQFIGKNLINDTCQNYPGVRSGSLHKIYPELYEYIFNKIAYPITKLSKLCDIKIKENYNLSIQYHLTTSVHECGLIHSDNSHIAGVIYLNPNPPPNSGTKIYSPKKEFVKFTKKQNKNFNLASSTTDLKIISEFCKEKKEYNQKCFNLEYDIVNRYNSIVLYPGRYWHGPCEYFGKSLEDSRLSIVLFFTFSD